MKPRARARNYARRAYEQLPPNLQIRARSTVRGLRERVQGSSGPALSVVMPVYNVESYLAEAVDSVLTQSFTQLELILVDDGSSQPPQDDFPGRSFEVLNRVDVLHLRRNLGHQRAIAIGLSYVWESGSDLVTGNVRRRAGKRMYQARNQSLSHLADRQGVSLVNVPELIEDTVAWNKIFRLDFWNAHVHAFPEGKLYEDMLPISTALVQARGIDILARPVYVRATRSRSGCSNRTTSATASRCSTRSGRSCGSTRWTTCSARSSIAKLPKAICGSTCVP